MLIYKVSIGFFLAVALVRIAKCSANQDPRQDKLNGDELISDSFDLKDVDGVAFEVKCRNITVGGDTFGMSSDSALQK